MWAFESRYTRHKCFKFTQQPLGEGAAFFLRKLLSYHFPCPGDIDPGCPCVSVVCVCTVSPARGGGTTQGWGPTQHCRAPEAPTHARRSSDTHQRCCRH